MFMLAAFISLPWFLSVSIENTDGTMTVATRVYASPDACAEGLVWAATHPPVKGTVVDATCTPGFNAT